MMSPTVITITALLVLSVGQQTASGFLVPHSPKIPVQKLYYYRDTDTDLSSSSSPPAATTAPPPSIQPIIPTTTNEDPYPGEIDEQNFRLDPGVAFWRERTNTMDGLETKLRDILQRVVTNPTSLDARYWAYHLGRQ